MFFIEFLQFIRYCFFRLFQVHALLAIVVCTSDFARVAELPSPKLTLVSNVDIFDGNTEKLYKNIHVLVKDNLIETVSNEPLSVIQTDNVIMIDSGGRTITFWPA